MRAQICEKLQEQTVYGLLVVDVADISNEEQMLPLVQYFDMELGRLECKFLSTANVLEKASSADAATLHGIITDHLNILKIPLKNLRALATDGASVITGKIVEQPRAVLFNPRVTKGLTTDSCRTSPTD